MNTTSIRYRPAEISDTFGIVKVLVDTWRSTYSHIISKETLQKRTYEYIEPRWRERIKNLTKEDVMYVAENDKQGIVGIIWGRTEMLNPIDKIVDLEKFNGELCAIYVLKNYQRRKIGVNLVSRVVNYLLKHNIHSMLVWVLKENPYKKFYEKLGARFIVDKFLEIENEKYLESAYVWEKIEDIFPLK
ncbi:MAG: GNAT family N-acetyltransferase [Promethearchaeota archaeon]